MEFSSNKKATPRFELGVKALQAPALPLGHVALPFFPYIYPILDILKCQVNKIIN